MVLTTYGLLLYGAGVKPVGSPDILPPDLLTGLLQVW